MESAEVVASENESLVRSHLVAELVSNGPAISPSKEFCSTSDGIQTLSPNLRPSSSLSVGREGLRKKVLLEGSLGELSTSDILENFTKQLLEMKEHIQGVKDENKDLQEQVRGLNLHIQGVKDENKDLQAQVQGLNSHVINLEDEQVRSSMFIVLRQLVQNWKTQNTSEETQLMKEIKNEYLKRKISWVSKKTLFSHEVLCHQKILQESKDALKQCLPNTTKAMSLKVKIGMAQSCLNACLAVAKHWLPLKSKKLWNDTIVTQYFLLIELVEEANMHCHVNFDANMLKTIFERAKQGKYSFQGKQLGEVIQKIITELQATQASTSTTVSSSQWV